MTQFDRTQLKTLSLSSRKSKSSIESIAIDPDASPPAFDENYNLIEKIADAIVQAKKNHGSIILAFGAHLVKNGLGLVLRRMVEEKLVTHLATNGAGSIHDWEFAFHGKSEEDVRYYVQQGQFGMWEETGNYINLALLVAAARGKGYGESIAELIHRDRIIIPNFDELKKTIWNELKNQKTIAGDIGGLADLWAFLGTYADQYNLKPGEMMIKHPFKRYSVQEVTYFSKIPITVHPGFGYDIIYSNPYSCGSAIGRVAEIDWLKFANSIAKLEGGVYLSIGSAIMSPMIFEKALAMARNVAKQNGKEIKNFMIAVNDIQDSGGWKWGTGIEPPKDSPAYYLRFCKTFDRMGARGMHYVRADNRAFLINLYHCLKKKI